MLPRFFLEVLLPRESSNKNTKDGKNTTKTFGDRLAKKMKIWNFTISPFLELPFIVFFPAARRATKFPSKNLPAFSATFEFCNSSLFLLDAQKMEKIPPGETKTWAVIFEKQKKRKKKT